MKSCLSPLVLALALVSAACGGASAPPTPSTPTDADRAAVRDLTTAYQTAWNAKDAAAVAALVSDTYQAVLADGTHIQGRAAFQERQVAEFGQMAGLTPSLTITQVYADWIDVNRAITGGTWRVTGGAPGVPDSGSYMTQTMKGADGRWRLTNNLVASLVPPPTAPPAAGPASR
jgi:uncharacterized protein (TIGR02246 family)